MRRFSGISPIKRWPARAAALLLAGLLVVAPAACTAAPAQNTWLEQAALDAKDTPEALYQAALAAGGSIMVYTTSTRTMDAKASFEAEYPGLVVEVRDLRGVYLAQALEEEHSRQAVVCDVAILSDNDGTASQHLLPDGLAHAYLPWDMAGAIAVKNGAPVLSFEAQLLFTGGAGTAPVQNLWELCEPAYAGRVYMPNPLISTPTYALLETLRASGEALAEAYLAYYGEPIDIPAGSTAGEVYLQKLIQNGVALTYSSDEVAEAVAAPGQTQGAVGFLNSSKLRMNSLGYTLEPLYQVAPFTGVLAYNCVLLADGAPNVSGAKLFIRWVLGEAGGTGAGALPFMQPGSWPTRSDVESAEAARFGAAALIEPDTERIYKNKADFEAFWLQALEDAGR